MKSIFIITNYYPPEIGAAANRIYQLAEGLKKLNYSVSIVAPLPNYPRGKIFKNYKNKFKTVTDENGITVYRLWLLPSNSKNKIRRFLAMLSYSFSLIWFFVFFKIPRIVIIQSPPLLVAFTSVCFLRSKQRKLILNVSDLWPLAGLKLGVLKKNIVLKFLERIEHFNYKNASSILGQSNEILEHVSSDFPNKKVFLYRNYPNLSKDTSFIPTVASEKIKLVYAGLLGIAQGVFQLCKELDYTNLEFHIYGSGPEQYLIEHYIECNKHLPIVFHGELKREKLLDEIVTYNLAIIPLIDRIFGSVPSKIFEYATLGLPILYFGGGEGEIIVEKYRLGWVSQPGDYKALNNLIKSLKKNEIDIKQKAIKETAYQHFNFNSQIKRLGDFID